MAPLTKRNSDITLDAEVLGMAAGLCHIVRKLHPKKVVHVRAERFLII